MLTLWDIMRPASKHARRPAPPEPVADETAKVVLGQEPVVTATDAVVGNEAQTILTMSDRYQRMTKVMLQTYGVRVRKWRSSMSGVAWQVLYKDGSISRLIEAPRPKGPMSAAIFLHEIGHHAIGFNTYSTRCTEEYHAWRFSLDMMEQHELNITDRVHERMRESLRYAIEKAQRRGLRRIPPELLPFVPEPSLVQS